MLTWSQIYLLLCGFSWGHFAFGDFTREMGCSLSLFPSGLFINWTSKLQEKEYVLSGQYVPKNVLFLKFQMHKDIVFLVSPRFRCGIPFTLGYISINDYCKAEPLLSPFPSWEYHNYNNSEGLRNIIDIYVDNNKILWALDIGTIDTLTSPKRLCSPRVIGISLITNEVIHNIYFGSLVKDRSRLQQIQVEEAPSGETFIYVSDAGTNSVLVWDLNNHKGFKVILPDDVKDGATDKDILFMLVVKRKCAGSVMYLTYMNGKRIFHIKTCLLRESKVEGTVEDDGFKPGRMVFLGTDGGDNIFFRLKGEPEIFMWDTIDVFSEANAVLLETVPQGRLTTQVSLGHKRLLWALSSNFPDYISGQLGNMGTSTKLHPLFKFCDESSKM